MKQRGPAHERLEAFIGTWQGNGTNLEGAEENAGVPVTVSSEFRWLPGKFFVEHRGTMRFGSDALESLEMLGADDDGRYTTHQYDSMGFCREYTGTADGDVWRLGGDQERVTITFEEGGSTMHVHWERDMPGKGWVGLCDFRARRS